VNSPEVVPGEQTRATAAKKAGFPSEFTYRQAKAVVANGSPELVQAMDREEVSVSAAATLAGLPKDEQREVLKGGPEKAREKAREIRESQADAELAERLGAPEVAAAIRARAEGGRKGKVQ
jgi:hypothetical protein